MGPGNTQKGQQETWHADSSWRPWLIAFSSRWSWWWSRRSTRWRTRCWRSRRRVYGSRGGSWRSSKRWYQRTCCQGVAGSSRDTRHDRRPAGVDRDDHGAGLRVHFCGVCLGSTSCCRWMGCSDRHCYNQWLCFSCFCPCRCHCKAYKNSRHIQDVLGSSSQVRVSVFHCFILAQLFCLDLSRNPLLPP